MYQCDFDRELPQSWKIVANKNETRNLQAEEQRKQEFYQRLERENQERERREKERQERERQERERQEERERQKRAEKTIEQLRMEDPDIPPDNQLFAIDYGNELKIPHRCSKKLVIRSAV